MAYHIWFVSLLFFCLFLVLIFLSLGMLANGIPFSHLFIISKMSEIAKARTSQWDCVVYVCIACATFNSYVIIDNVITISNLLINFYASVKCRWSTIHKTTTHPSFTFSIWFIQVSQFMELNSANGRLPLSIVLAKAHFIDLLV